MKSPSKPAAGFRRSRCTHAVLLALGVLSLDVSAQTLQRVEITGSSIKRIEGEQALPVQVITREDIDKSGATTAAELVKTISANTAPLTDGASITTNTNGQSGMNSANMRGIGVSSTLVLLNGRRLANFATPGDNAAVDLNNIPAGAIQRVEILKDGASAIYGTDAIGGVINFITRKDYTGIEANASHAQTHQGGAAKNTASVSFGFGNLEADNFNVFGVLDRQGTGSLRSGEREFIRDRPTQIYNAIQLSTRPFPANFRVSSGQRNALRAAGVIPADSTIRDFNPFAPGCNPPAAIYAPETGLTRACNYDFMRDTEIFPETEKQSFLGRATFKLSPTDEAFVEYTKSNSASFYRMAAMNPNGITLPVSLLPEPYRTPLMAQDPNGTVGLRIRATMFGGRTHQIDSDATRLVAGLSGVAGGWDYEAAYSLAENKVADTYFDGFFNYQGFQKGITQGLINPFGAQSAAGQTYINSIRVSDTLRDATGITESVDGKISKAIGKLAGGDLALALGAEFRKETNKFNPSALLVSNTVAGDCDSPCAGPTPESSVDLGPSNRSRNISSFYAELIAPVTKELELQLALRHDHYDDVGSSTNPKIAARWTPAKDVVVRASAATGFRAPSLNDLYGQPTYGSTNSMLTDPYCVNEGVDTPYFCTDLWSVTRRNNPDLKPEKSKQFSLGVVFEPAKGWTASVDYWNINVRDIISTRGEQTIVENAYTYNGTLITRDSDGYISNIILRKENQGEMKTSGLDLGIDWKGASTPMGRFGVSLNGTLVLAYDRQFGPELPFESNLGRFLNDQVIQRWRHRLSLDWESGPYAVTVSNQYSSSYRDQNLQVDPYSDSTSYLPGRDVEAYSLWDITGKWSVTKNLTVRAGVLNVFDTPPPFSNQQYFWLANYDPSYTDPRGRTYTLSASYKFK